MTDWLTVNIPAGSADSEGQDRRLPPRETWECCSNAAISWIPTMTASVDDGSEVTMVVNMMWGFARDWVTEPSGTYPG